MPTISHTDCPLASCAMPDFPAQLPSGWHYGAYWTGAGVSGYIIRHDDGTSARVTARPDLYWHDDDDADDEDCDSHEVSIQMVLDAVRAA